MGGVDALATANAVVQFVLVNIHKPGRANSILFPLLVQHSEGVRVSLKTEKPGTTVV